MAADRIDPPAAAPAPTRVRMRDFSRSLPMALLRAREAVMRHFRPSLRRHDITEQQWRVLRALTAIREIEVTELARATCLLPPSLSRILKDLEDRALIERRTAVNDLRRGVISISPQGLALIEAASPQSEAIYQDITRRFGPEKLAQLQDLLRELEAVMQQSAPPEDDGGEEPPQGTARRRGRPKK